MVICLRCGHCCIYYDVVIVKPEAIIDGEVADFFDESIYI